MRINFYSLRLTECGGVMLVKEKAVNKEAGRMNCPEEISVMMGGLLNLNEMAEEHVYMLALNNDCRLLGIFPISSGTVNASLVTPREVYIRALLSGASMIVLIHNHPSGNAVPSGADINITERVKKAGELINVPLADHIIVGGGNDSYFSFKEANLL